MAVPTTVDPDTELSAVNTILGALGQSPVTTLGTVTDNSGAEIVNTFANPEIALIYNILRESSLDIQNEGWAFNKEYDVKKVPDSNKQILIANNILSMDVHDSDKRDYDVVIKVDSSDDQKKLYDRLNVNETSKTPFEFDDDMYVDIVYWYKYEDIPSVFKRYITYRAAVRSAVQMTTNAQLVQMLTVQEQVARAACMEHECNQGDHNFLGQPRDYSYSTYKPYRSLRR